MQWNKFNELITLVIKIITITTFPYPNLLSGKPWAGSKMPTDLGIGVQMCACL